MVLNNITRYLVICDSFSEPNWIQKEVFDIVDSRLAYNWHCNNFVSGNEIGTIIGYNELANNYQHMLDLVSHNQNAIKIFLEQKDKVEYFE